MQEVEEKDSRKKKLERERKSGWCHVASASEFDTLSAFVAHNLLTSTTIFRNVRLACPQSRVVDIVPMRQFENVSPTPSSSTKLTRTQVLTVLVRREAQAASADIRP